MLSRLLVSSAVLISLVASCKLTRSTTGDSTPQSEVTVRNSKVPSPATGTASGENLNSILRGQSRWLGFARVATDRKLPIILDIAPGGVAVMKFATGDFMSQEYAGVYLNRMAFDSSTSAVIADSDSKVVRQVRLTAGDSSQLTGNSATNANVLAGEVLFGDQSSAGLLLRRMEQPDEGSLPALQLFADVAAVNRITGDYVGTCDGKQMTLQLEASRWSNGSASGATPLLFTEMRIGGRFGLFDSVLCGESDQSCVHAYFRGGSYDPVAGLVTLQGSTGVKSCKQNGQGLECGNCSYTLTSTSANEALNPASDLTYFAPTGLPQNGDAETSPAQLFQPGQFFGWLHIESQDRYQHMGLNVLSANRLSAPNAPDQQKIGNNEGTELKAVASLYFGDQTSQEFVAHRLSGVEGEADGQTVLNGIGDGFLVVESYRGSTIRGTWFSKTAGRVGKVYLTANQGLALGANMQFYQPLSGVYEGDRWQFEISASANVSESASDFYPLRIYGWAREKIPTARRRTIESGSFDFYTNTLALRLDDGRVAVGRATPNGVELFWAPIASVGTSMERQALKPFVRRASNNVSVSAWRREAKKVDHSEPRPYQRQY